MNTINQMKNIIVLKDLPSNIIEEALVILKPNKKVKVINKEDDVDNETGKTSDYIIKEAEIVISSYLSNMEEENKIRSNTIKKMEHKYKRLKRLTMFLSIISTMIILSLIIK